MQNQEEYSVIKTIFSHIWIRNNILHVLYETFRIYTGPNTATILHCERDKCGTRTFTTGEIYSKAEEILTLNKTANKVLEWPYKRSLVSKEQMLEFLDAIDKKDRDRSEL